VRRAGAGLAAVAAVALAALGCGPRVPPERPQRASPWHRSAVVYGVVPPLFGPAGEVRPLVAVTERLDALRELGVDALWIAPVMDTDDRGAISYQITDFRRIRPDYGTEEDLRALVRAAHARRMKVLLDVVPNHTSTGHPWYRDAQARGPASPYWSWYDRDPQGVATHYFDWKHLPNLNYANPAVRREMTASLLHWIREFDVDGFRVDAAWGIRDRAPDAWPEMVRALRAAKPGLFLVAEASAREPYWVGAGFDAAYDWTHELGRWAWERIFDDPATLAPALDAALSHALTPPDRVLRFLENNDTGDRFVTRHGLETTRVAAVLLHALPGIPALFTGSEVGAAYRPYEDPAPLDWSEDRGGLRAWYARLAALREELPALREGGYRRLEVPGEPDVFAFVRDAGAAGRALVVLNFGGAARLRIELPPGGGAPPTWDALRRGPAPARAAGGRLEVDAGAREAFVLVAPPA
jgi:glycosidase